MPEDFAAVLAIIEAFTNAQFEQARRAGARQNHEAYRADGVLVALAAAGASIGLTPTTESPEPTESPAPTPPAASTSSLRLPAPAVLPDRVRWSMCVIVDAIALKRGYAAAGEMCEIPGVGPVSVDWARSVMDDAIVDVLVHDSVDIRAYASATRHKPRPVQLALMVRDRHLLGARLPVRLAAPRRPLRRLRPGRTHRAGEPQRAVRCASRREDPSGRAARVHRHRATVVAPAIPARIRSVVRAHRRAPLPLEPRPSARRVARQPSR